MTESMENENLYQEGLDRDDIPSSSSEKIEKMMASLSREELLDKVKSYEESYADLVKQYSEEDLERIQSATLFRIAAITELGKRIETDEKLLEALEKRVDAAVAAGKIKPPSTYEGHKAEQIALWLAKGLI